MNLNAPVSVRFDAETTARLEVISDASGLSKADLVRRAVEEFLAQVERTGEMTIRVRMVSEKGGEYRVTRKAKERGEK